MIVHKAPIVNVLAWPNFMEPAHLRVKWVGDSTNAEKLVEYAGRLCYMSQANPGNKPTSEYLRNILEQAHGSVLEHANITLLFEGISRSLTHELVRHRAGFAYSQLSQRYVDESDCAVVMPPAILNSPKDFQAAWIKNMLEQVEEYTIAVHELTELYKDEPNATLRKKRAREAARSVLPNATETKVVVTANCRAWRHLLEMRGSLGADQEFRRLAFAIAATLIPMAPGIFGDIALSDIDNVPYLHAEYHKV